jgi:hypothetical protein
MTDYNPPPVNAFSGKKRKQQYDDRIAYETGEKSEASPDNAVSHIDDENDAAIRARRAARSRTVEMDTPNKEYRRDPIATARGALTDVMVGIHNKFSKKKIE